MILCSCASGWVTRATRRLSVSKKISGGYFFCLGIAVTGIIAGYTIGDYQQRQATEIREYTQEKIRFLHRLQNLVLLARTDQQQLIPLIGKPEFKQQYSDFLKDTAEINQMWPEVQSFLGSTRFTNKVQPQVRANFVQTSESVSKAYLQKVKELIRQINLSNSQPKETEAAQKLLLNFSNSPVALNFDNISDDLTALTESAYQQSNNIETALIKAEDIRAQIIASSILLSVITATLLAISTTRAIARPIITVTDVAQQVTQESNFDLQAPVTTEDEVGLLAVSLNQLIQWVATYTQELKQAQAQLIQTEKMSSLGQMVAGVAHEINNPVNFIYGNLECTNNYMQDLLELVLLYQQQYPIPTPDIQEHIEAIELDFLIEDLPKMLSSMKMGAERIRQIVLSLRNFSRLDEAELKSVNIHEGIDNTLLILDHRIKQKIEIIKEYGDLPMVECYPAQLNQVFMNILSNAIDALLTQAEQSSKQITIHTEVVGSNQIKVRIKDNGPGIPTEIKPKLFDPFFTTKPVGQGTGLGLSISYQIIQKHLGRIEVSSEFGQGTEFLLALPVKRAGGAGK